MSGVGLLVDAAIVGAAIGIGAEIGLILAVFGMDFDARLKSDLSIRQRAKAWATEYPGYVRRKFSPDPVPMAKYTAGFVGGCALGAVVLVVLAIGLLEVLG